MFIFLLARIKTYSSQFDAAKASGTFYLVSNVLFGSP